MMGLPGKVRSRQFSSSTRRRSFVQERRQPAADPEVELHVRVVRVGVVHEGALFVRHHLERQLVVVAEEETPLAGRWDRRRVREDVGDGQALLQAQAM